jgi:hypothetical protein
MENDNVFTAGQVVPPGTYRRVDVPTGRLIALPQEGPLPASLDGTIALYRRVVEVGAVPLRGAPAAKRLVAID